MVMRELDKMLHDNLKADGTPVTSASLYTMKQETLAQMLRQIADDMEAGDWSPSDAAVLIVRDDEGFLTYCEWGETGELLEDAYLTKKPRT